MTEILKIGRLLKTDSNGFIISESNSSKIKSPWKEAVDDIKQAYIKNLGDGIHSIYVRGTVSRGEAIEGISDIDTFAVLNREVRDGERMWFKETRKELESKYSFATDIELNLFEYAKLKESFLDSFTIKVQSACIYGVDLTRSILPFKADLQTAVHFHRNLEKLISKATLNINKNISTKDTEEWCRWIMKRIVRAGFTLVMDKENAFTRDLYPSYEIFSKYYPEKEPEMKKALELAINPSSNGDDVINFISSFGMWVSQEIEKRAVLVELPA